MHLDIITPEKPVLSDDVDEIIVSTTTGQITILPNHVSLFTQIAPGEMTVKKKNDVQFFAVTGGFLEVVNNAITLLADYAVRSQDIEVAKAEEAKKRAERVMAEKATEKDFAQAEAQMRRALLELKVAQKRTHRTPTPSENTP